MNVEQGDYQIGISRVNLLILLISDVNFREVE